MSRLPPRSELNARRAPSGEKTGCRSTLAPRVSQREGVSLAPVVLRPTSGHSARFWIGDRWSITTRPGPATSSRPGGFWSDRSVARRSPSAGNEPQPAAASPGLRRGLGDDEAAAAGPRPAAEQRARGGPVEQPALPRRGVERDDRLLGREVRAQVRQRADLEAVGGPAYVEERDVGHERHLPLVVAVGRQGDEGVGHAEGDRGPGEGDAATVGSPGRLAREAVGDPPGLAADGRDTEEPERRRGPAQEEQRAAVGREPGLESDGPAVSATSSPVASCFSQMRERPSRVEVKAIVLPSGDAEGPDSLPL